MRSSQFTQAIIAIAALSPGFSAEAADYVVDAPRTQLVVQVFKEGVASGLAHDHVVAATEYSGKVSFDDAAGTGSISVEVKAASLKADDAALRTRFKLPPGPSSDDRATIEKNLKSEGQLNIAQYPTITFQSTKITRQPNGRFQVVGNLTLRGKTKQVEFPANVELQGANFHGQGEFKFNQTDFGFEPYSAMFGAIRNKDGLILTLDIVATPVAPKGN